MMQISDLLPFFCRIFSEFHWNKFNLVQKLWQFLI